MCEFTMSSLPTVDMGAGYDREERKKEKEEPRVSVCVLDLGSRSLAFILSLDAFLLAL